MIEKALSCPKCKAVLPNDSEFCQVCGTKLSTTIIQKTMQPNDKEELFSEIEVMEIKGSNPVIIQSAHLYCSADKEKYYLRCNFKSLSKRVISALMIDVLCFDIWGSELPTIQDIQILDLSPQRDEEFTNVRKIPIIDVNTRTVKIKLKRIRFEDGTIEECSGEEIKVPKALPLDKYFNSQELTQLYIYATSCKAVSVPMQVGDFWMCSCGQINANDEENCIQCKCEKQIVFDALNTEFLEERHTEYEEKIREIEELRLLAKQKRQEEERDLAIQKRIVATMAENKRKKKIKAIIISIIISISVILVAISMVETRRANVYRAQLRNFATETMEDSFTNVYADVVSINPMFYTYEQPTTVSYSRYEEDKRLNQVICHCKTVEGKYIWATFSYREYPGINYSRNIDDYNMLTYSSQSPMRLVGKVDTASQVNERLEFSLGDVFVLNVREASKKTVVFR